MVVKSEDGRELRSFNFKEEDQSQEVRAVERRVLLETLASKLPKDTLRFSSKLASIEPTPNGDSLLHLMDGSNLLAKIVIGCDGIRSPIAKWMGFSDPNYSGHSAFRGLGYYPSGQPYPPKVTYVYGRGLRAGFVPVSPTKVYWFICFNSPSPSPTPTTTTNPSLLKQQAKQLISHWPTDLASIVDRSPDETVSRTPLVDRWLWPAVSPGPSRGRVVVVGDAWHPMTPNLGQGACCALEDSVVLAKKLAAAIKGGGGGGGDVEGAFRGYGRERWGRVFPLTARASVVGSVLQWENPLVCYVRNNVVIPKLVRLGPLLEHTNFSCDTL
ncbi:monooxygenase 2 isoform X1 [Senna tora]|uniref:Monooxygenase 2 isoform X1 n=1 Tax=Senna tora TaxID=362788 RepID=A0A834SUC3_9FABA|nr:monooxygenase 2 isoform X1 [Senna tora]